MADTSPVATAARLADKLFLPLLVAAYALAAVFPDPGLRIGGTFLAEFTLAGEKVRLTAQAALLAVLLWNAGLAVPARKLAGLARRPSLLAAGLFANLAAPLAFIAGVAALARGFLGDEMNGVLVGLGVIAAMPIAGSAAAWARKADGDEALGLGLVVSSTLLSPLTTPVVLAAVGFLAGGRAAGDLSALASGGTGLFLALCVLLPSLLGMLTLGVAGEARVASAGPRLKLLNAGVLLVLVYTGASATLPQAASRFAPDFIASMLAVAAGFCVVCFASGWLVGKLLRADPAQQTSLLFGLGMNNNGTGLVLATTALGGRPEVLLLVVCYNLVQHLVAGGVDAVRRRGAGTEPVSDGFAWRPALRSAASFGFLLAAGVVVANSSAAYWNMQTVAANHRRVAHTHEVMTEIKETLSQLKDAETGQRGYLITGDRRYLEPYESSARSVRGRFEALREMVGDNPEQAARADALEGRIDERLAELDETVRLRRDAGFEAARKVVLLDRGKDLMDDIRRRLGEMEEVEMGLLERRTAEFDERVGRSLGMVVVVAGIVLVSFFVRKLVGGPGDSAGERAGR